MCFSSWCFLHIFPMFVAFEYAMMMRSSFWSSSLFIPSFSVFAISFSSVCLGLVGWCGVCTKSLLVSVLLLLDMYIFGSLVTYGIFDCCAFFDCAMNIFRRVCLMCPLSNKLWNRNSEKYS